MVRAVVCVLVAVACGAEGESGGGASGGAAGSGADGAAGAGGSAGAPLDCPATHDPIGDACAPRFDDCPGPEVSVLGGGCAAVGVPADGCDSGFVHDGDGACTPVMPPEVCGTGEIAVPGDTACSEIAACGAEPWGNAPVDATTIFVDAAATPPGDGTQGTPFPTIVQALAAAGSGNPLIAVAAGTYVADLVIDRRVRIHGRCPTMVEIQGTSSDSMSYALTVTAEAELRGFAVTGPSRGISITGVGGVLADLWVHDTGRRGIQILDDASGSAALVTATRVLVERTRGAGIGTFGGLLSLERSVVRDTLPEPAGAAGWGVYSFVGSVRAGEITLRGVLVEGASDLGVFLAGGKGTIEGSLIRNGTGASGGSETGWGISAQPSSASNGQAELVLRGSVVSGNHGAGVVVTGGTATIERSVIRDTRPGAVSGDGGEGLQVQFSPTVGTPSRVTLSDSVIERASGQGIYVIGSEATIARTIVRDVEANESDGRLGRGISAQLAPDGTPTNVTLDQVLVERSVEGGVLAFGAVVDVVGCKVRDVRPSALSGTHGQGIGANGSEFGGTPTTLTVRDSVVERAHQVGIGMWGSFGTLENVLVEDTLAQPSDGRFGDGVHVATLVFNDVPFPCDATMRASWVQGSARAGVGNFGAATSLEKMALTCNVFDLDIESRVLLKSGGTAEREPTVQDLGGNSCGCMGASDACHAQSSGIDPVAPVAAP